MLSLSQVFLVSNTFVLWESYTWRSRKFVKLQSNEGFIENLGFYHMFLLFQKLGGIFLTIIL